MMSQGLEFTGVAPFKDALIHGMVRDSQGRKMSKTLGNGIDPIEIIDEYGADALRFAVISGTTMGNDIRYMPEKLEQASNFANKIWNAAKFIRNCDVKDEDIIKMHERVFDKKKRKYNDELLNIEDKWIINKLETIITELTNNIEKYDLGVALDKIYSFIWNEFCDWYIEMVKTRMYSNNYEEKVKVCYVLDYVFGISLKLLHPFMPFVTTEIYRNLVKYNDKDLMVSKWPYAKSENQFKTEEDAVQKLKEIIVGIRNIRNTKNIHPSKKSKLVIVTAKYKKELEQAQDILLKLGFAEDIEIIEKIENAKESKEEIDSAMSIILSDVEIYIPLKGLIDIEEEKARLEAEVKKLEAEVARGEKMLSNPGFVNKAPETKVNEEKEKLAKYREMLELAKERLEKLK